MPLPVGIDYGVQASESSLKGSTGSTGSAGSKSSFKSPRSSMKISKDNLRASRDVKADKDGMRLVRREGRGGREGERREGGRERRRERKGERKEAKGFYRSMQQSRGIVECQTVLVATKIPYKVRREIERGREGEREEGGREGERYLIISLTYLFFVFLLLSL